LYNLVGVSVYKREAGNLCSELLSLATQVPDLWDLNRNGRYTRLAERL